MLGSSKSQQLTGRETLKSSERRLVAIVWGCNKDSYCFVVIQRVTEQWCINIDVSK